MNHHRKVKRNFPLQSMAGMMKKLSILAAKYNEDYYIVRVDWNSKNGIEVSSYIHGFSKWVSGQTIEECVEKLAALKEPVEKPNVLHDVLI